MLIDCRCVKIVNYLSSPSIIVEISAKLSEEEALEKDLEKNQECDTDSGIVTSDKIISDLSEEVDNPFFGKGTKEEEEEEEEEEEKKSKKTKKRKEPSSDKSKEKNKKQKNEPNLVKSNETITLTGDLCYELTSPLFKFRLRIEDKNKLKQDIFNINVTSEFEVIEIVAVFINRQLTLKKAKDIAKRSEIFKREGISSVEKNKRIEDLFLETFTKRGYSDDLELVENPPLANILTDKSIEWEMRLFFKNAFRSKELFDYFGVLGSRIALRLNDEDLQKLKKRESEEVFTNVLREILFKRNSITPDGEVSEFLYLEDKKATNYMNYTKVKPKICEEIDIIKRANNEIFYLFSARKKRGITIEKKVIGDKKFQIPVHVYHELKKQSDVILLTYNDFTKSENDPPLEGDEVNLQLTMDKKSNAQFCDAINSMIGFISLIGVQDDSNHLDNYDPYFNFLNPIVAEKKTELIFISSFDRHVFLRIRFGNMNICDSNIIFNGCHSASELVNLCRINVKSKKVYKVVLERCHRFSTSELTSIINLFRILNTNAKRTVIERIFLVGSKYCYPEAPGKPFTDLFDAANQHRNLFAIHDFHDHVPAVSKIAFVSSLHDAIELSQKNRFVAPLILYENDALVHFSYEDKQALSFAITQHGSRFCSSSGFKYNANKMDCIIIDLVHSPITQYQFEKILSCAPIQSSAEKRNFIVIGTIDDFKSAKSGLKLKSSLPFATSDLFSDLCNTFNSHTREKKFS